MNKCFLSVQTIEDPKESYDWRNKLILTCKALVPAVGKGDPTQITIKAFSDRDMSRMQQIKKDMHLFISAGLLRWDYKAKELSVSGGQLVRVDASSFPIINEVCLTGDCGNDIDHSDGRQVKFIDSAKGNFVKASQTLIVNTGGKGYDYFQIEAFNEVGASLDLATMLMDRTRKGTPLSIYGYLSTNQWIDKESGVPKSKTVIRITKGRTMTAPASKKEIKPQAEVTTDKVVNLWGGQTSTEPEAVPDPQTPEPQPQTPVVAAGPSVNPWGMEDDDGKPF